MKLLLLLIATATLAVAQKIAGGPLVINATPRAATVVWLVEGNQVTLRTPGGSTRTSPSLRAERTMLTGLQPNTRYEYDVAGQDAGKGSFKTPPIGAGPYQFAVYGDVRTRHDVHRKVMSAVVAHGIPDFVLHTGDLVADGEDTSQWSTFFDIEKELLRQTAFFPSLGNHERNSRNYYDFLQLTKPYYSFDWGNGHFIALNSDIGNVSANERLRDAFWAEQTKWLEEDLQKSQQADYRFVFAHHPPFTAVSRRQGDNPHMTALVPLFEKYRVTAAFFGHDHNYQRYLKNGIHYVVTGGGGAPLYDVDKPAEGITQKVISIENFVSVSVDGPKVRIEAIGADGQKLDEVEFQKSLQ